MASKRLEVSANAKNTDRISDLPDAILSHILSFMPTICAIRTRVLSRRWKHLFSLVPFLGFYGPLTSNLDSLRRFLNLVDWVFNSYNVDQMDKFSYYSSECLPESLRILSWISDSVRHGVQEIDITNFFSVPQTLPHVVFTCRRLTSLKIDSNFNVEIPDEVCLPHVRKIHLSTVSFSDSVSAGRLFRSCHVLEDLFLSSCRMGVTRVLEIFVPTLKSFRLCHYFEIENKFDLVLDAPNLEHFEYSGDEPDGFYALQDLKLLSKACVTFHTFSSERSNAFEKIVGAICHVRHLHLCAFTLEDFLISGQPLPVFSNLIHLEIKKKLYFDLTLVPEVLDRTPHLEVLVIDNEYSERGKLFRHRHLLPEDVLACVALHLKEVELTNFRMMEYEFKLVEYFLKNAKVLEKLKVRCINEPGKQVEVNEKLLALPRCSRACQII